MRLPVVVAVTLLVGALPSSANTSSSLSPRQDEQPLAGAECGLPATPAQFWPEIAVAVPSVDGYPATGCAPFEGLARFADPDPHFDVAAASSAAPQAPLEECEEQPGRNDACPLWVGHYNRRVTVCPVGACLEPFDNPTADTLSPDGSAYFVSYYTGSAWTVQDTGFVAFDTDDGSVAWSTKLARGVITGLSVSPDGGVVYAAGFTSQESTEIDSGSRPMAVALDAATGAVLWDRRPVLDESGGFTGVALTPDGDHLGLVGRVRDSVGFWRMVTVTLDARTGTTRGVAVLGGGAAEGESVGGTHIVAAPIPGGPTSGGAAFYVQGITVGADGPRDIVAGAVAPTDGVVWSRRFPRGGSQNSAWDFAITPDGQRLISSSGLIVRNEAGQWVDQETLFIAVDALTGLEVWRSDLGLDEPIDGTERTFHPWGVRHMLAMDPGGQRVYYTAMVCCGRSPLGTSLSYIDTVAFRVVDGSQAWAARLEHGDEDRAGPVGISDYYFPVMAVNPSKPQVHVVARNFIRWGVGDLLRDAVVTVTYDATSGEQVARYRWTDPLYEYPSPGLVRYAASIPGGRPLRPTSKGVAVSPDGRRLFSTLFFANMAATYAFEFYIGAIAYDTPDPEPTPTPTPTPTGEPTPTPTPTGEPTPTPTPTPSESPAPDTTEVSFTGNSATSGQYSDRTLFEARLADSGGDPIADAELAFELTGADSSRTFTATTDSDGLASVTPMLDEKPGPHQLTVRYAGDGDHEPSADTTSFVVDKEDSALELTEKKGKDKALVARLYDADTPADGIAGRTIDFYAGAELLGSATTDEDGVATFEPPKQKGKKQPYEGRFEGDDFYLASSDQGAGKGGKGGKGGGG